MSPQVAHCHRDEGERTVKYTVTIYDVDQPDAMPLWESFGHGEYAIWATDHGAQPTHVGTAVIEPGDELDP
jgi:hypothetical protein